jgi:ribose transport system ATP-binding protein
MSRKLIEMIGISKEFPGVKALNKVNFELLSGEVHALVGENGAGKSTLMKVLTGVYSRDEGIILVRGQEEDFPDIRASQQKGIVMIHQELNLMNHLTVAQNIFIGREETGRLPFILKDAHINKKAEDILRRLNVDIDPTVRVGNLTIAKQQMIEIAKALSYNSEVIIMDEPTASLTDSEIADLFAVIRLLRDEGKGIIYISHRLDELQQITDRITVMRDGEYIDTLPTKEATPGQIIHLMVGRELFVEKSTSTLSANAPVALEVRGVCCGRMVQNVSFHVRKGEILGFAGLMGAGRTETARAIFGADKKTAGEVLIDGKQVKIDTPHDAVAHGIAYLSEDRKRYGLMLGLDVETNVSIASMKEFLTSGLFIKFKKAGENAEQMVDRLDIRTPSIRQLIRFLSGGNQQKVVLAKWLTKNCDILIFDEPTRGIDVGAKSEIYQLLKDLARQGKAIVLISSELPEIIHLCDRVVVMCEGRVTGEVTGEAINQQRIMELATAREENKRGISA